MFTPKRLIGGGLFVFVLAGTVLAQENRAPIDNPRESIPVPAAAPLVTATATAKRVRFASPGTVVQLRLEVFNEAGQKLFDTELHGGNVLDWHLQDGAGERLPSGSYATVLTIKSLSGRLSQRVGLVTIDAKKAAISAAGTDQLSNLSTAQQQIIGPVEGNATFTILQPSEAEAITAVTHDGVDGQVTSTTGALTFRTGNVFAGKDKEHMRITAEGYLGIGTDKPAATLDVAGTIRTQDGIRFPDGTVLKSASNSAGSRTDANGDPLPALNVGDTGTQNRLAKWTETGGAGGLGDSAVFESGGLVGIGTTSPEGAIHIESPNTTVFKLVSSGSAATGRAVFQMYRGASAAANGWDFGYNTNLSSENFIIRELTNGSPATRVAINKGTGNFGIGTDNALRTLQIGPSINAAFTFEPSDASPNAGYIRFGDQTGWKLHIGRNREVSVGPLNTGTTGVLMTIQDNGRVGIGTTTPSGLLQVAGHTETNSLFVSNGLSVYVDNQPEQASELCISTANFKVGYCSSSLRYKQDVTRFAGGLDLIDRLRPVSFTWKRNGAPDIGLAAEEVEQVEPLLTFRNGKGEIEGVRYNQLSAVFINAFKEQQAQIRKQQQEITQLRASDAGMRARLRAIERALKNKASRSLRRR